MFVLTHTLRERTIIVKHATEYGYIVQPELRQPHEAYICDRAKEFDRPALAPLNWQEVPDFTVANLYHYFKTREGTPMQLAIS